MIRKRSGKKYIPFLLLMVLSANVFAYDISSHRPCFTLPARILTYERFLLEFGYTYTGTELANQQSIGDLIIRIGIFRDLETIFGLTSYKVENNQEEFIKGVGEGFLGFKVGILRSPNDLVIWHPNFSILAGAILPAGDSQLREDTVQPGVKGLISWPVMKNLSFEGNYNYAYLSDNNRKFHQLSFGIALKIYLFNLLNISGEVFSLMPETYEGDNTWYYNLALAFYITDSVRIDIHGGKNIAGKTDSYIAGGGFISKVDIF